MLTNDSRAVGRLPVTSRFLNVLVLAICVHAGRKVGPAERARGRKKRAKKEKGGGVGSRCIGVNKEAERNVAKIR